MRGAWIIGAALLAAPALAEPVRFSGTVVPNRIVEIRAAHEGMQVADLLAESGDSVQAGQLLARLRDDEQRATLDGAAAELLRADAVVGSAQADILVAQSGLRTAEAQANRATALGAAISREDAELREEARLQAVAELAKAQAAFGVANADVATARATVETARLHLADTQVRAPVAGLILSRDAEVGAAATALFRIGQGGMVVEAAVLDPDFARVRVGQRALVRLGGAEVQGIVASTSGSIDAKTRIGTVRIAITAYAVAGSFASGEVVTDLGLASP